VEYWKWVDVDGVVWGVFRAVDLFEVEVYKERRWQSSDFLLRVYEDPMFVEITEQEALSLIEALQPS
jgi:hypothetical protein